MSSTSQDVPPCGATVNLLTKRTVSIATIATEIVVLQIAADSYLQMDTRVPILIAEWKVMTINIWLSMKVSTKSKSRRNRLIRHSLWTKWTKYTMRRIKRVSYVLMKSMKQPWRLAAAIVHNIIIKCAFPNGFKRMRNTLAPSARRLFLKERSSRFFFVKETFRVSESVGEVSAGEWRVSEF